MVSFYWFALVLGAGLLLFSLGSDADGDMGGDVDAGTHTDLRVLSVRTITYFLFGFGATGALIALAWRGERPLATAALALLVGCTSGAMSAAAFRYLHRSQSGSLLEDDTLIGRIGRVVLPLSAAGSGKIEVERGGRELELTARPFDASPEAPETWDTVVIVDMDGGTALVSPYRDSIGSDQTLSLPGTPET
jgi:membrane protein implicated in regulation of membrane protease activity